jgi:hypothetical protein
LDPLPRWRVEVVPDSAGESIETSVPSRIYVREKVTTASQRLLASDRIDKTGKRLLKQFAALDPIALLETIHAAQQELSTFSNRDPWCRRFPGPEYLAAFAAAWHSDTAPNDRKKTTTKQWWRTRADPFAESWPLVETWLAAEPNLSASELLPRLRQRLPDLHPTGAQLRSLQRWVKVWRAERARLRAFATASAGRAAFDSQKTSLSNSWILDG